MDTRYTLFLQNKIIGEYGNHTQMRDEYTDLFPLGSYLFSSRHRVWYDRYGARIEDHEVPTYLQHLQLVLGL